MIHVIDNHLAADCRALLQSMFADRKRLFVDLFGWDVPVVDGQYEMDQFDTAHAIYIVIADRDGEHEASLRLLPTVQPHMIDTVFRDLCPIGIPSGEAIWESTRLCLPQRHGAGGWAIYTARRNITFFCRPLESAIFRRPNWTGSGRSIAAFLPRRS